MISITRCHTSHITKIAAPGCQATIKYCADLASWTKSSNIVPADSCTNTQLGPLTQQHHYGEFSYQCLTWPPNPTTLFQQILVPTLNLAHSPNNIIMVDFCTNTQLGPLTQQHHYGRFCNKAQLGPLTQQYLYDRLGQFQPIQLTGRLHQITPTTVKHGAPIPTLHTLQNPPRQPTQILLSTNGGQSSYSLCHEYCWQSGLKWSELHHSGLLCDSCPPNLPRTSISQPYLRKIYIIFIVSNIIIYKALSAWPDFPDVIFLCSFLHLSFITAVYTFVAQLLYSQGQTLLLGSLAYLNTIMLGFPSTSYINSSIWEIRLNTL